VGAVVLRHLFYIHYSLSVGTHIRHSGLDSVSASAGMLLLHSVFETQGVLGLFSVCGKACFTEFTSIVQGSVCQFVRTLALKSVRLLALTACLSASL